MLKLPFEHLNLTRNPFGEMEPVERAQLACVDLETMKSQLEKPSAAIQLIGDCGRGKSTHLLALRFGISVGTYLYCEEDVRTRLPALAGPVVIVDEAQRLSRTDRSKLFRSPFPIAIGTHTDYTQPLERSGRNVMQIEVARLVTVDHLLKVFNARIEHVRRAEGSVPRVTRETAARLADQHGTNVRQMESDLYDVFQSMSEPIHV